LSAHRCRKFAWAAPVEVQFAPSPLKLVLRKAIALWRLRKHRLAALGIGIYAISILLLATLRYRKTS